jgi:starvation-inducible DNA-binding protein
MMKNSPGLSEADAKKVAGGLAKVLSDTYVIYLKTHGFHWNVEGPNFRELHFMLEEQYTALWNALDVLAERIRALGHYSPGSNSDMVKMSKLSEEKGVPTAEQMLLKLIEDHDTVCNTLNEVHEIADKANDSATTSMLENRLDEHQKFAWMLRAQAKKQTGDYVVKSVADQYA